MRRIKNKQNRIKGLQRNSSHANFSYNLTKTIAEVNQVSSKNHHHILSPNKPFRISIPDYFNIPKFQDQSIFGELPALSHQQLILKMRREMEVKQKLKDLEVLAMGMRRAKSIKQESRYYFTEGVLLHNSGNYQKSINAFQKFLKIVLFLKDDKSIELALNTIGSEYMHLKNYPKAMEYHQKQGEISQRSDLFSSHVNLGLCYELVNDKESALKEYRQAERYLQFQTEAQKKQLIKKLIDRVEQEMNNLFLTSETKQKKKPIIQKMSPQKKEIRSAHKSNSVGKMKMETSRVQKAIQQADEKMEDYLASMKNSFVLDDE